MALADISNVKAVSGGKSLPVNLMTQDNPGDVHNKLQKISISFPTKNVGLNKKWQFTLSYDTASALKNVGGARMYTYPQHTFDNSSGANWGIYTITLKSPVTYGRIHPTAKPTRTISAGDIQQSTFDKDAVLRGFQVSYGDYASYGLNFKFPVKNPFPWWRSVSVMLPPDLYTQDVLIKKIDPAPTKVQIDSEGNIIASYFLYPLQSLTVNTDVVVRVKPLEYDLSLSGGMDELPKDLVDRYTKPEKYWQADNSEIKTAAMKHFDAAKSVAENVRAMYRYTVDTLTYNAAKIQFNTRQGAIAVLKDPSNAVCMEYADFLIANLRAVGIPARNPVGYAYQPALKTSDAVSDSEHSWVEVFIPEVGWTSIDPTWGENTDNFGYATVDHLAFKIWDGDSNSTKAVFVGNRDLGYQYEKTELKLGETADPQPKESIKLSTLPLPFFVLTKVEAINTGNVVVHDVKINPLEGVSYPSAEKEFGDTASYEKNDFYYASFGGQKKITVGGTALDQDGRTIQLDAASTSLPFLISYIEGGLIVLIIILWPTFEIIRRRKRKALPPEQHA